MIVTQEGQYKDKNGIIYDVFNVSKKLNMPRFRAFYRGGYYNVNDDPTDEIFGKIEIEMVEYIGPFPEEYY